MNRSTRDPVAIERSENFSKAQNKDIHLETTKQRKVVTKVTAKNTIQTLKRALRKKRISIKHKKRFTLKLVDN